MCERFIAATTTAFAIALAVSGAPSLAGGCPQPGEPGDLRFESDGQTLFWSAGSANGATILVHDLIRSSAPWSFPDARETVCVESNDAVDTMARDAAIPPPNGLFAYLPRAETECGLSSLGGATSGVVRAQAIQCGDCLSDATCDDGLVCNGIERCPGGGIGCQPGVPLSCGEFSCGETFGGCLTTCSDDVDCAAGFGCLQGSCLDAIDVTSTADEPDESPGDGECRTASGACTLRAAIQTANDLGSFRLIRLPEGIFLLTRPGAGEDAAETGDLDLLQSMAIRGVSAARTWVDAQQIDRVFHVGFGVPDVTLARLKVQSGRTPEHGGGILNEGTLQLVEVEVNANHTDGDGGGILNLGLLGLQRSTVSFNEAAGNGGGIANLGSATVEVSTISSNDAVGMGGGIYQDPLGGDLALLNVTVYRNAAGDGGGLYWPGGSLAMTNTALAGSISGGDCSGVPPSNGHNLAGDLSCDLTGPGDLQEVQPLLSELLVFLDSGIRTHYPLEGSPLDGAGDRAATPPVDQNGSDTDASPAFIGSVGKNPVDELVGPGRLYRASLAGIDIYETLLHSKVGFFATPDAGNKLMVNPDGTRLYSSFGDELKTYIIAGDTLSLYGVHTVLGLESFDIHPSGAWVFLCSSGAQAGRINTIHTATNFPGGVEVPGTPSLPDCAVQSLGQASLMATTGDSKMVAFEADGALTQLVTGTWSWPWNTHLITRGPAGTFFTLEYNALPGPVFQNRLSYVSSPGASPIPLLDLPLTDYPAETIAMHPDGTRLYVQVPTPSDHELLEVNTNPAQVTFSWPNLGGGLTIDPLGYLIYSNGNKLTAISASTHQVVTELLPSLRSGLAVKP